MEKKLLNEKFARNMLEKSKSDTSHSGTKSSFYSQDPIKFNQKDQRISELYWGINKPYSRACPGGLFKKGEGEWPKGKAKGKYRATIALIDCLVKRSVKCIEFWFQRKLWLSVCKKGMKIHSGV